ncbi:MAG: Uncharacterized protein XD63_1101 [Thermoanaerobacterales bacterium 50_218]|nr:MAG: Uncharacterized protein XD63_1101 [Thermoanaerobacterales bacterium 50_218]
MFKLFRGRRKLARLVLYFLVGILAFGLVATSVAWYLEPDSPSDTVSQPSASPQEEDFSGELEHLLGLVQRYEKMLAERPDDLAVLTGYARVAKDLGSYYLASGERDKAKAYLEKAAENYQKVLVRQESDSLHLELADVYQLLEEYAKAEREIDAVLAKQPEHVGARIQKGFLKEAEEDWEAALKIWSELAKVEGEAEVRSFAESRKQYIKEKIGSS